MEKKRNPQGLIVLIIFVLVVIWQSQVSGNQKNNTEASIQSSQTHLATPSSTPTIIPIATPTPTKLDQPSAKELEPELITTLGKGVLSGIVYSPDGKIIALGEGAILRWYDAQTFEELGSFEADTEGEINNISFSSDGEYILVEHYYIGRGVEIIDLTTKKVVSSFGGETVFAPEISLDKKYVAYIGGNWTSGGWDYYLILWNVLENNREFRLPFFGDDQILLHIYISPPAISPDSTMVAAGSSEKLAYIWDIETGEIRFTLKHASRVTAVDFSPDGRYLATGSLDGLVRLWNPQTGELEKVLNRLLDDVYDVRFTPDSKAVEVEFYEQPSLVWEIATGRLEPLEEDDYSIDTFTKTMYSQGFSTGSNGASNLVLFSPDGETAALASEHVLLWDINSQELIRWLENPLGGDVRGMAYSTDSRYLGAVTTYADVLVWDTQTGEYWSTPIESLLEGLQVWFAAGVGGVGPGRGSGLFSEQGLAFSVDSKMVVFANGRTIEVWNAHQGEKEQVLDINKEASVATNFSFSEDGSRLYVILNRNRAAQVWDIETGEMLLQIDFPIVDENAFTAIGLNRNLFARNNSDENGDWIELWNLDTEEMMTLTTPNRETEPIRFSPDGSLLVAIADGHMYFWRTDTGQLIHASVQSFYPAGITINSNMDMLAVNIGGKLELYDINQIPVAVELSEITPAEPLPTATPYGGGSYSWSTPTPRPTQQITPVVLPALSGGAISPENADNVVQLGRFSQGRVTRAGWSPDGHSIIVSSSQGVYQYRASDLTEKSRFETGEWIYHAGFNSESELQAVGVSGDEVVVWDVGSGEIITSFEGMGTPSFNPGNSQVVFTLGEDRILQTRDLLSGELIASLPSYYYYSYWPVFSPDGRYVAAIQSDDSGRVWDAETGEIVNVLGNIDGKLRDLNFSLDGRYVIGAAGSYVHIVDIDPEILPQNINVIENRVPDPLPRSVIVPDNNITNSVTAAALSPDGQYVAAGTGERYILLVDRYSGEVLHKMEVHTNVITHLVFRPDGKRLLSIDADGTMAVWEVPSGKRLVVSQPFAGEIEGLVFRIDGNLAAWEENTAWVISPKNARLLYKTRIHTGTIYAVSPGGEDLAVYNPKRMELWNKDGEMKQILEGEAVYVLLRIEDVEDFFAASFSASGDLMVAVGSGGAWIIGTSSGELVDRIELTYLNSLALSQDGKYLATCNIPTYDCIPSFYNLLNNGSNIGEIQYDWNYEDFVTQYKFTPDGTMLGGVSVGWENPGRLYLWEVPGGGIINYLDFPEIGLLSIAFSPDMRLAAVGRDDGKIDLVDMSAWQVIATLEGHNAAVLHLAFSRNGLYLASGSEDGTVRVWGLGE